MPKKKQIGKDIVIRTAHAVCRFDAVTEDRVFELMNAQCSAMRSAYQAIRKHKLEDNAVKVYVKKDYMQALNQRYIEAACSKAKLYAVNDDVCFGGKKNWGKLIEGELTKDEWQRMRNNQLYSQGDRTKSGNPNIRIVGDKILINDPITRGKWLEGKIFLPKKFEVDFSCYSVRLVFKNDKFEAIVQWQEETCQLPVKDGAIAVDCNPDGVAVVEIDGKGNLLNHKYILKPRIQFASKDKRDNDIRLLAKEVVQIAYDKQKKIVLEKLSFKAKKGFKKFNRMRHNFVYRKMIEAIKQAAVKMGVQVIEVDPAYTSVLGVVKYSKMYSLNRHTAAAFVIGRRGIGIKKERESFTVKGNLVNKGQLNLEGRGCAITLPNKSFPWLKNSFLKPKKSYTHSVCTGSGVQKTTIGTSVGEIPTSECFTTIGRKALVAGSNQQDHERGLFEVG